MQKIILFNLFLLLASISTLSNNSDLSIKWHSNSEGFIKDLVISDLNKDGIKDIIFVQHSGEFPSFNVVKALDGKNGDLIWGNLRVKISDIELINYNDDDVKDIVTRHYDHKVTILDGLTGDVIVSIDFGAKNLVNNDEQIKSVIASGTIDGTKALRVTDLDSDGSKEIIASVNNSVKILSRKMTLLWSSPFISNYPINITIGNVDSDEQKEVLFVPLGIVNNETAKFYSYDFVQDELNVLYETDTAKTEGLFFMQDIDVGDIDDSKTDNEIVLLNATSVSNDSSIFNIRILNLNDEYSYSYSVNTRGNNQRIQLLNLDRKDKKEILLLGSPVKTFNGKGDFLWSPNIQGTYIGGFASIMDNGNQNNDTNKVIFDSMIFDASNGSFIDYLPRVADTMGGVSLLAKADLNNDSVDEIISGHHFNTSLIVYEKSDVATLVKDISNSPKSFKLSQNYPNPFNPTTTISYTIPEQTNVKLEIFDPLGRKVSTLVNENKTPGNYYQVEFNAENLPSGLYIYRIVTDKFTDSKKLLLLK